MAKTATNNKPKPLTDREAFLADYFSDEKLETARFVSYEGNASIIRYTVDTAAGVQERVDTVAGMPVEWSKKLKA